MAEGDQNDGQEKVHEPSERKLQKSREQGQVAMSKEVGTFLVFVAAGIGFLALGGQIVRDLVALFRLMLVNAGSYAKHTGNAGLTEAVSAFLFDLAASLTPLAVLFLFAALAPSIFQNALVLSPERIKPKASNISPAKGFKKIVSLKNLVEFLKGLTKIAAVCATVWITVAPALNEVNALVRSDWRSGLGVIDTYLTVLILTMIFLTAVVAVVDILYQRFEHNKQLRMTHQEVKDEQKQTDGNPEIKKKLRELRMEKASQRMMSNVPDASVVIANPTHYAVALAYDRGRDEAPRCVAKGVDEVALRIRSIAEENDVPVAEEPQLARALYPAVELDSYIPREHYKAVAAVLKYVGAVGDATKSA